MASQNVGKLGYGVQGWVDRPQLFVRFLPFNGDNCWQHVQGRC